MCDVTPLDSYFENLKGREINYQSNMDGKETWDFLPDEEETEGELGSNEGEEEGSEEEESYE